MTLDEYRALVSQPTSAATGKYGNQRRKVGDVTYDSVSEFRYSGTLRMRKMAGEIDDFFYHVIIPLHGPNGEVVYTYEADFIVIHATGEWDIIDIKTDATMTTVFINKAKHLLEEYGIAITCIDSKTHQPLLRRGKVWKPKLPKRKR